MLTNPKPTSRRLPKASLPVIALLLVALPGCSLFVMAGKMILGDPKITAAFTASTGESLTDTKKPVVFICSAPHRLLNVMPSLQFDIVDQVSRTLRIEGVNVVDSGEVASWYDDHGEWGDFSELAAAFDAGYVVQIKFNEFDHRVPKSETLLQGKAQGHINVYKVYSPADGRDTDAEVEASIPVSLMFDKAFSLKYPESYQVPRETRSEDSFLQAFVKRTSHHISQHFYDYRRSDLIY